MQTPRPALVKIVAHLADLSIETVAEDYEFGLEMAYANAYRKIIKVPVEMYIYGLLNHWKIPVTLDDIKEATLDVLQVSGIEQTFRDEDWDNLELITQEEQTIYVSYEQPDVVQMVPCQKLNTTKAYMTEFFEL